MNTTTADRKQILKQIAEAEKDLQILTQAIDTANYYEDGDSLVALYALRAKISEKAFDLKYYKLNVFTNE